MIGTQAESPSAPRAPSPVPPAQGGESAPAEGSSRLLWVMLWSLLLGGGAAAALWANSRHDTTQQVEPPPPPPSERKLTPKEQQEQRGIDLQILAATAAQGLAEAGLPMPPEDCAGEQGTAAAIALVIARQALERDAAVAAQHAATAVAKCPAWAAALNIQGNALSAQNKLDEASEAYARALREVPDYDAARFNLGVLQLRRKDAAAIDTFSELLKQKPSYPDVHKSRAQAYLFAKRYREGLSDLEQALKEDPDDGTVWLMVGQLRAQLHQKGADQAYCEAAKRGVEAAQELCKVR
jgi:tetratricopeptide (TPR) repeat protein